MPDHVLPRGRRSYGWTAAVYSIAERLVFGSGLMRARLVLLPKLEHASDILILGEGDGRFLAALVRQNPNAHITVVDRSQRMLARAAARVRGHHNVHFTQQDASRFLGALSQARTFDAIVTLFVLDCLTASEIELLVGQAAPHLSPHGGWLWADFAIPHSGPFRPLARLLLTLLYRFFRATTDTSGTSLVDTTPHFDACGLKCTARAFGMFGMVETRYLQAEPCGGSAIAQLVRT